MERRSRANNHIRSHSNNEIHSVVERDEEEEEEKVPVQRS
jgi:hypothetical protein